MRFPFLKINRMKLGIYGCIIICMGGTMCSSSSELPTPSEKVVKQESTVKEKLKVSDFIHDYSLIWEDNFDGSVINMDKWKYRAEGTVRGFATVSKETIALDGNGNLVIQTRKVGDTYQVGQLTTDGLFAQKFGYFECRAQMQKYMGTHSAFWLQSNTMGIENNNPTVNGTEIDIFEYHRKTSNQIHHNLHWNGYGSAHKQVGSSLTIPFIGTDFHTFGLLWTEKEYIFFVDGVETWRTTQAVSHIPEYIILSTELTGFGGDHLHNNYPDGIIYDYVKVYRAK